MQVDEVLPEEVKSAGKDLKSAGKDISRAAQNTADDVQKAAESASKEAGQPINAATDTIDLVSQQTGFAVCLYLVLVCPDHRQTPLLKVYVLHVSDTPQFLS